MFAIKMDDLSSVSRENFTENVKRLAQHLEEGKDFHITLSLMLLVK